MGMRAACTMDVGLQQGMDYPGKLTTMLVFPTSFSVITLKSKKSPSIV